MADQKMFHENDHKLDEMLDAMLSAYSSADPRPGLETRILAGVKEQAANSTSRWRFRWTWAVAALATAALVMMAIYVSRIQTHSVEPQVATRPQHQQMSMPDLAEKTLPLPKATASHPSTRRQRTQTAGLTRPAVAQMVAVRQDVFPSRSPLSEQEKLLLRYLTRTPREELIAQSRPDPPDEMDDSDSNDSRPQNLTQIPQRSSNTK
jgi:hypothetical protein